MKNFLLLLVILLFSNDVFGQLTVRSNKQWEGDQYDLPFGNDKYFNAKFRNTPKLINGKVYHEMTFKVPDCWFEGNQHFYRQDGDKVYELYNDEEKLILDFGLEVGDSIVLSNETGERFMFVANRVVDTLILDIERKKLEFKASPIDGNPNSSEKHVWIEGVGDIGFFFGNRIVYGNQRASVVFCAKEIDYIYGSGEFCPFFFTSTDVVNEEVLPDYYFDPENRKILLQNDEIILLEIYGLDGAKLATFSNGNGLSTEIDLSDIHASIILVVVSDGRSFKSQILRL